MDRHELYQFLKNYGLLSASGQPDQHQLIRPAIAIVAAAGKGSRLDFTGPKIMLPVGGAPILVHLYRALRPIVQGFCLVVSPQGRPVIEPFAASQGLDIVFAVQDQPRGMADAVLCAEGTVRQFGENVDYVIAWGDQASLSSETVAACLLYHQHAKPSAALTFPTCCLPNPYIHFTRDAAGRINGLLQKREGDVMPTQGETDCGIFVASGGILFDSLRKLRLTAQPGRSTQEFNFLPLIPWLAERGFLVQALPVADPFETLGVNTREDEARVAQRLK